MTRTAALSLTAWCAAWAGAAATARFAWVEHAATAARCDGGALDAVCVLRSAVIQAFILDRLGLTAVGLALGAAGLAWWRTQTRSARLALGVHRAQRAALLGALAASSAGLWLYAAQWAAPALLLAAAIWVGEDADQVTALAASASKTPA